jgi:hypothetical protein
MNHVQISHSGEVQRLHALEMQKMHAGSQNAENAPSREGKICLHARMQKTHKREHAIFACRQGMKTQPGME